MAEGKQSLFSTIVDVTQNFKGGLPIEKFQLISPTNLRVISKGITYNYFIKTASTNKSVIEFSADNVKQDILVNAGIYNFEDVLGGLGNNNILSPISENQLCIACAVVIVAAAAFCTYRHYVSAEACKSLYANCVRYNKCCSMEYESTACGGNCDVKPCNR